MSNDPAAPREEPLDEWQSAVPRFFETVCSVIAGLTLSIALISMAAQVVARYLIGSSLIWSEELSRYALIWSAMVGSAVAYQRGAHIGVAVFVDLLPAALHGIADRLIHLIVITFAAFLFWQGSLLTFRNFERHQLTPALQIPIAWIYLAIPVGALLIALAALIAMWREFPLNQQRG